MDSHQATTDRTTTSPKIVDVLPQDDGSYIWLPFSVLLGIIALSALVYLMARNNRDIRRLYCKRRYTRVHIDDDDSDVSIARGDDYGEESATECLLKGKLQINNRHESYQATQVTHLEAANTTNENGALPT